MTFDALAMHAITDEISTTSVGGRVDAVYLINGRRVGIELYGLHVRRTLVLSLAPDDSRIYYSTGRVGRGTDTVTPFLLLLRKHVRGGRLVTVEQPRLERVLCLHFTSHPEDSTAREVTLVAEAMGRRSNLILVDEDATILDCLERLPPAINPARPLLPHLRYAPPPRETQLDPTDPTLGETLAVDAALASGPAWNLLVRTVAGMSPLLAREALHRACGLPTISVSRVLDWAAVAARLAEIVTPLETGRWTPSVAWDDDHPVAYAAYQLTHRENDRVRLYATMSEVLEVAGGRSVRGQRFERIKQPLLQAIQARAEQVRRKRSSLERSLASADTADELRTAGEAILANLSQIEPRATSLEWDGRRIDLYPALSPVENAQSYFRQYEAARDAGRVVPPLLEEAARELAYLDEMALHVVMADGERDLTTLRRELETAKVIRSKGASAKKPPKQPARGAYRQETIAGGTFVFGTSAVGNETVTFDIAAADDVWFHVRGAPGAHVILRSPGATPRPDLIEVGASLAAAHSAKRDEGRVEVDYTTRRHVHRIPHGAPGQVSYRNERTISVAPAPASPD